MFGDAIETFPLNESFHTLIGLDGSQDLSPLIPVTLGSTDTRKTRTFPGNCVTRLAYRTTNVTRTTCKNNQTREFVTKHYYVLATTYFGSISAALSCLVYPPSGKERGLISRTAAGNRAYFI